MIKRIDGYKNNFEKSYTTKVGEHTPCGYSVSMIWTFDGIENKHDVYWGEYYMKKNCESLRELTMKIIKFENNKIVPSTNEQQELYEKTKICCICKK